MRRDLRCIRNAVAVALLGASVSGSPASAESLIEGTPTGWRLQNYTGGGIIAYFTGSSCGSGSLLFGPTATLEDKSRFFAMVMTAKVSGHPIGVFYENSSGQCLITSFYMKP